MRIKPHIKRRNGIWLTLFDGEIVFHDLSLEGAFVSARICWRHQ